MTEKKKPWSDFQKQHKVKDKPKKIEPVKKPYTKAKVVEEGTKEKVCPLPGMLELVGMKNDTDCIPPTVYKATIKTIEKVEKPTIKQLALNNQLVRTYVSLEEASDHTGIAQEALKDACEGVDRYIFAGFKWMYI